MSPPEEFWEQPEVVERFAARDPDLRLQALLQDWDPALPRRALDVGCAGGRNTVLLAQLGWDVLALDASAAMVRTTRRRLAAVLGEEAAHERVRRERMDALPYPDGDFALVLSLGVLHIAGSWPEWSRAADEIVRVLQPGGCFLVSQFTPDSRPGGEALDPVAGEAHVFGGYSRGRAVLLNPPELDAELQARGLTPLAPAVIARGTTERGQRVSVNGLYRK